jgi:uncharacterized membrane-anchored protein
LGASFADWVAKPAAKGAGLGFGDGPVTLTLVVVIFALVVWIARAGHGIQQPRKTAP